MNALKPHASDFRRDLANNKYEISDEGIYFPSGRVLVRGVFTHNVNGKDERSDSNLVVNEGLLHMLSVTLNNGTKIGTWYLSLYAANYTPLAALTQASYPATASEITSGTEGYSEATRQEWVESAPSSNAIDNVASKAAFTIVTASSLAVNGAGLHSTNVKGDTTGTLFAASKFSATRTLYNADVFNLSYRLQLTAS